MSLTQLIYASRPFGFDDGALNGILESARRNNPRSDITGALICRADIYLQVLEGPEAAVATLFARISADDRHLEVRRLYHGEASARMFPAWAMRHDPARSWLWSQAEVEDGAVERASVDEVRAVFARLASDGAA